MRSYPHCGNSAAMLFLFGFLWLMASRDASAFIPSGLTVGIRQKGDPLFEPNAMALTLLPLGWRTSVSLFASKKKGGKNKKAKAKKRGGGFGGNSGKSSTKNSSSTTTTIQPARADKDSLEAQWDSFAAITDLEIKPPGDPEDEGYEHFEVADVFVRSNGGTGWFRIGKVCASEGATLEAALTLQKGLVFWTAVHMRKELLALGKAAAASALELGYILPASIYMGSETDRPMDPDEEAYVQVFGGKAPPEILAEVRDRSSIGFRPDWNPLGFTYKRRESAALRGKSKRKSTSRLGDVLEEEDS